MKPKHPAAVALGSIKSPKKAASSRENGKKGGRPRRPKFEQWATMAQPDQFSEDRPRICLWGDQESAINGRDDDEVVCLVRVEVLEVLEVLDEA